MEEGNWRLIDLHPDCLKQMACLMLLGELGLSLSIAEHLGTS